MSRRLLPVVPIPAASLLLFRGGSRIEVLLGRRDWRHSFVPGVYVAPGGRVDAADGSSAASALGALSASTAAHAARVALGDRMLESAVAAARESWEETGLTPGRVADGALQVDLPALEYLGRATTNADSPIRFDTLFFACHASHCSGDVLSNGELHDLHWQTIPQLINNPEVYPLVDVTEHMLLELFRRLSGAARQHGTTLAMSDVAHTPHFHYSAQRVPIVEYE